MTRRIVGELFPSGEKIEYLYDTKTGHRFESPDPHHIEPTAKTARLTRSQMNKKMDSHLWMAKYHDKKAQRRYDPWRSQSNEDNAPHHEAWRDYHLGKALMYQRERQNRHHPF